MEKCRKCNQVLEEWHGHTICIDCFTNWMFDKLNDTETLDEEDLVDTIELVYDGDGKLKSKNI